MERLHAWSVDDPRAFWQAVWDWGGIRASEPPTEVVDNPSRMPGARWFRGARLSFAENLLDVLWEGQEARTLPLKVSLYSIDVRDGEAIVVVGP